MATEIKASISHADTDVTPIFAQKVDGIFGGHVSVLPNRDVLNSARRQSKRRDVELSVAHDRDGIYTVYRCGVDLLLVDAYTNDTTDLYDATIDEDERTEFVADHPELAALVAEIQSR